MITGYPILDRLSCGFGNLKQDTDYGTKQRKGISKFS